MLFAGDASEWLLPMPVTLVAVMLVFSLWRRILPRQRRLRRSVAAVVVVLHAEHGLSLPWTFNRKEAKDHGEGGTLVGAPLASKRVLILDDVLTAGTAIRESLAVLRAADAAPVAVVVGLDRQETVDGGDTALARLAQSEQLTTAAVVTLDDLLQYIGDDTTLAAHLPAMQAYRARYGAGR